MPAILKKFLFVVFFTISAAVLALDWDGCWGATQPGLAAGQKVAVVVFPQNPGAERYVKTALSRVEGILADNRITALDREKVEELKDVFRTLDDPGAFVTAEDFLETAEKFDLSALVGIYLNVAVVSGLADYFTASAHADLRFISEKDAKVASISLLPMGSPGRPPSDGLTRESAAINAVQRAVDEACEKFGLENLDPASPRLVRLDLEGPRQATGLSPDFRPQDGNAGLGAYARLEKQGWRAEEVTCTALAPAGDLGAVAGYVIDTDFRRRPQRLYGSRVHLVDTQMRREIQVFECFAVEKKQPGETASRQILDCMFVSSWRYLAAVSSGSLFFWDTERGKLLSHLKLETELKTARLNLARSADGVHLIVEGGKHPAAYRIVRRGD